VSAPKAALSGASQFFSVADASPVWSGVYDPGQRPLILTPAVRSAEPLDEYSDEM
jgi:hypothetical protein